MKSSIWILIVVIAAGVVVGIVFKDRLKPPEPGDQQAQLKEIGDITDSEAKLEKLQHFIADYPKSELKPRAYSSIAKEMLEALKDTTRFVGFARQTIEKETDPESKAIMYYRLYDIKAEAKPEEAALVGSELLKVPIDVGWLYNYIGYDLADRGRDLDLALSLCQKSVELAKTRDDSASFLDARGFVYYKKGMYQEAVADLEKAVGLYSEPSEDGLRHLAMAYTKAGDAAKAFATYRKILVIGEYDYARGTVDSMMTVERYSPKKKQQFEEGLWQDRAVGAASAVAFSMPNLAGQAVAFEPAGGKVVLLNFMSPT
ncbi:MAG TPA: tetratricopeptide repeat protein [bacterium]|nr:tetratricopeptide repeat protein [bacterium]